MAQNYFIDRNHGLNTAPGRVPVALDAGVKAEYGNMIVEVAGFGQVPAAANASTGKMKGLVLEGADNTGGIAGAKIAVADVFTTSIVADATNPPTAADVGKLVYASSGTTVSRTSTDGPPAGKLIEYNTNDPQGRPCRVALDCMR